LENLLKKSNVNEEVTTPRRHGFSWKSWCKDIYWKSCTIQKGDIR